MGARAVVTMLAKRLRLISVYDALMRSLCTMAGHSARLFTRSLAHAHRYLHSRVVMRSCACNSYTHHLGALQALYILAPRILHDNSNLTSCRTHCSHYPHAHMPVSCCARPTSKHLQIHVESTRIWLFAATLLRLILAHVV